MNNKNQKVSLIGVGIWLIAASFFLYEFFLRTFVGSIAHQVIPSLHLSIEEFTMVGSAYYIAYGVMQIPVGILADKFGVKGIMVFAALLCAIATYLFSMSTGFYTAIASRFLMGLGSSFAFLCLLIIVSNWFPEKFFGFFAGLSQFIGTMGPALAGGPLIAFLVETHTGWRHTMQYIGDVGILIAFLALFFVRSGPSAKKEENRMIFLSKTEPLWPRIKNLLKTKQAWVIACYSATVYISISLMAAIWGTEYLETRGLSQYSAASMVSIAWIAYAVGCPLFGILSDLTKRRKPWMILCGLLGLVSTFLIVNVGFKSEFSYAVLFFMFGLAATGQNLGFATILEQTERNVKGAALGLNNGLMILSAAILPLIVSKFISHASHGQTNHLSSHDFFIGLSFMPVLYFISLLITIFFLKETFCSAQKGVVMLNPNKS